MTKQRPGQADSQMWTRRPLITLAMSLGAIVAGCSGSTEYDQSASEALPAPGGGVTTTGQGTTADTTTGQGTTGDTTATGGTTTPELTTPTGTDGTTSTGAGGAGTTTTTTGAGGAGTTTAAGGATTTTAGGATTTMGAGGAATTMAAGGTATGGSGMDAAGGSPTVGTGGTDTTGAGGVSAGGAGTDTTPVPTYMCDDLVVTCTNGKAGQKDCKGVNELAYLDGPSMQGGDGNDIWGWEDPMTGKEYALMGLSNGTAFVDISDPCRPVHLGHMRTETVNEVWRDIKVYKNYAYVLSESTGHGLQVFDLSQLRDVTNPPVVFTPTNVVSTFGSSHNLALNEETGFAYALSTNNCPDGRSFDLSDPRNPVDVGCWGSGSRTHDAQCVVYKGPDMAYNGKELCFTGSEGRGLFVYDMTDKSNVAVVSQTRYPNLTYAHQVWLTEDHQYLMLADEQDELDAKINMTIYIFDMTNLAEPVNIGAYVSDMGNTDHQLYVRGNYAFLSAYSAGVRILDLTNIAQAQLTEVGYFDTYPEDNNPGYNGQWSVYPYFKSGVIVTSGIVKGMHILQPDLQWIQPSQWTQK